MYHYVKALASLVSVPGPSVSSVLLTMLHVWALELLVLHSTSMALEQDNERRKCMHHCPRVVENRPASIDSWATSLSAFCERAPGRGERLT